MQCPPWEEFELRHPWLCGADILHMKSPEAKSSGSNVVLKSGSSLSCKIYQRFCLKGTDLQECAWSACLIRERGSIFFFTPALGYICRLWKEMVWVWLLHSLFCSGSNLLLPWFGVLRGCGAAARQWCQMWDWSCGTSFLAGSSSFTSWHLTGWSSLLAAGFLIPLTQLWDLNRCLF